MTNKKKIQVMPLVILVALTLAFFLGSGRLNKGSAKVDAAPLTQKTEAAGTLAIPGEKNAVAAYIKEQGMLPDYYITKEAAQAKGWTGGSLEPYAPGCLIGGDRFGNYESLLPNKEGRSYMECDIGTFQANTRGTKRIVFSNDGLIYYTDDHYASFTKLSGGE
jgi:guanyl-specific ribonuclease Sa